MALEFEYTDVHGVDHLNAYGRINYYAIKRELSQQAQINYVIEVFASNNARRNRRCPLAYIEGQMEYDDQGPIRLADIYTHAKTLPEFINAIDII